MRKSLHYSCDSHIKLLDQCAGGRGWGGWSSNVFVSELFFLNEMSIYLVTILIFYTGNVRFPFPAYPENMNGAGYPFPNPAAAVAAAAGLGVHSTTMDSHPPVPLTTAHSTPHSTLADSGNHLPKPESSEVH